ncbi:armadillo-type protein [Lobosporangium transversale]|uniref:Armadillo-type protein n=1 Tax=Lobosporangium transversale TaxID=64571 RepID=A0A1Y2G5X3_9FUNG|nr:armadillo-type protein [Lobosporangium transversale]ORY96981.1 armadillo-type protein [Lobosporangium transversale]|eukprot:XP_021875543.1 armadillo-type protein [Lobosporangium transversale]
MDEATLRSLIQALETIHNPTSANEARRQAEDFCEDMRRHAAAPMYGYYLAHKDKQQPDVLRHFGVGLMEYCVRYRWTDDTLIQETKESLKQGAMSLISEGLKPMLEEQSFIKEKVARLFVAIAEREWPLYWPSMNTFLKEQFFKDELGKEMVLLILKSICEDVWIYNDPLAALRQQELRTGLLEIMASQDILKKLYPDGWDRGKKDIEFMYGEEGNEGWTKRISSLLQDILPHCQSETITLKDEKLAVAALKTLAVTLDWILCPTIASSPIVQLICQTLLSPSIKIRLAGAECYDSLACRNMTDVERNEVLWPVLDQGGMDLISRAYLMYATQLVQGGAYEFVQKMVQATVNLGEQQLCAKRNTHAPKDLFILLQLLHSMASHPSVLIVSIVTFFWSTILRHETFSKNSVVCSFAPKLLEIYSAHLAKDIKNRWNRDPIYKHFAIIDFDSFSEFQGRALQLFQRAADVIRLVVPIIPLDAFFWVANRVSEVLMMEFPFENVKETSQFKVFDGTLTLMETTVSSLTEIMSNKAHPQSTQLLGGMNSVLSVIIEYDGKCSVALERVLASIPAFSDMFKQNSTLLYRSLDKLFKAVEYPSLDKSLSNGARMSDMAANTLVKIGRAIPNILYPIYGEIESAIQRLVEQNIITQGLKKTLQSFLLVIGFNSDLPVNQTAIFEKVVLPVIIDFQSTSVTEALSTPRAFLTYVGVDDLCTAASKTLQPVEINQLKGTIIQRRQIKSLVEALHTFMKETIDVKNPHTMEPWAFHLSSIMPNLFSTMRSLNAICNEQVWTNVNTDIRDHILSLSAEDKIVLVTGKTAPSAFFGRSAESDLVKLALDIKIWLAVLRDQSYRVLAQISLLGSSFYATPSLQVMLEQSLFEHVDFINNRQLRFLINYAVQPLVKNCPEPYMDSVLSHLLMHLFSYLDQRLRNDWALASEEGLVIDEMEDEGDSEDVDISDGIAREAMLRDLTRDVASFVCSILEFGKQKPMIQDPGNSATASTIMQKEITPLALSILSRQAIAQAVITLLCHIVTLKDTKACVRAVDAIQRTLVVLVQNSPGTKDIIGAFSAMVLKAAMEAIHDPYHQEGQEKLIQLITEVYVEVRPYDIAPKAVFQQALGADIQRLEEFEQELAKSTSNRTKKHALVKNFLQSIIGVAKSEWFKQKLVGDNPTPGRTIDVKYDRPSKSVLDSEEHDDIGEGLASLFDE